MIKKHTATSGPCVIHRGANRAAIRGSRLGSRLESWHTLFSGNCFAAFVCCIVFGAFFTVQLSAQSQSQNNPPPPPPPPAANEPAPPPAPPPPTPHSKKDLDQLVSRIALYPDPLLAQVLTAATFENEIPDAAAWANEHSPLRGDALANAIREDNLQWDPSVLGLLPFPSVLNMMAQDTAWTQELGDAVLADRAGVMDAVQRMRKESRKYGYLQTSPYDRVVVDPGGYVEILPVNPAYIYVPAYDPLVVFGPPAPGFFIGGAIGFGPAVVIGASFYPFGWAHPYFGWGAHMIFFDETPWMRGWANRRFYVHSYAHPFIHGPGPRVERHGFGRR